MWVIMLDFMEHTRIDNISFVTDNWKLNKWKIFLKQRKSRNKYAKWVVLISLKQQPSYWFWDYRYHSLGLLLIVLTLAAQIRRYV